MEDGIRNRVEESGIVQLDLSALLAERTLMEVNLAPQLWQGLAIRETEFRSWLSGWDTTPYAQADVALHCSAEAIVPEWAWMLVSSKLMGTVQSVHACAPSALASEVLMRIAEEIDPLDFEGKRVVVKGCGLKSGPGPAMRIVERLQPVVKSLMFGEPCSTVPVYKSR